MTNNLDKYVDSIISIMQGAFENEPVKPEKFDEIFKNSINLLITYFEGVNGQLDEENVNEIRKRILMEIDIKLEINNTFISDYNFKPWFKKRKIDLDMYYWNRYKKYLEKDKKFSANVVSKMDIVSDSIVDLLGDPTVDSLNRRGLIIGDVQSGKTATYIGLVNKAVDAGFKIIILLTGTIEELRRQTQIRVDEGFIGKKTGGLSNESNKIGVARHMEDPREVVSFTTQEKDFELMFAKSVGYPLTGKEYPVILVLKKNVNILKTLLKWIENSEAKNSFAKIDNSILVIDDEADFASLNTKKDEDDPTKTNDLICKLLDKFKNTCYVGFTATPYANIFVEPSSEKDMKNNSLFPQDFIYCLDSPSNYIGPVSIFGDGVSFDAVPKHSGMIRTIERQRNLNPADSIHTIIPLNHKKDLIMNEIPKSLKEAIRVFFLANAIRDLRGDINKDRTMLINISRFTNVHLEIRKCVDDYINELTRAIYANSKMSVEIRSKNKNLTDLENTYNREYSDFYSWERLLENLYKSIADIKTVTVNTKSKDSVKYNQKNYSERVIVIGGFSLSRGLTLEGLMVSYFHRGSSTYDTLMQMGRWFGYRDHYADICRIWMSSDAEEFYTQITHATEELKQDLNSYKNSGKTPLEFGIRVRSDINSLLITARNKMRGATDEFIQKSISGEVVETPFIDTNIDILKSNYLETVRFINELEDKFEVVKSIENLTKGFHKVKKEVIVEYLKNIIVPSQNIKFQNETLSDFINDSTEQVLDEWDVCIASGSIDNKGEGFAITEKCNVKMVKRKFDFANQNEEVIRMSGPRCRLGSPGDGVFGLSKSQKDKVVRELKSLNQASDAIDERKVSQKNYFTLIERKPLLTLYFVDTYMIEGAEYDDEELMKINEVEKNRKEYKIIGWGIGIPKLSKKSEYIKYKANRIFQQLRLVLDGEDEQGEE